jgi:hypothetical protein
MLLSDDEIKEAVGGVLCLEQYLSLYRKVAKAQLNKCLKTQLSPEEAGRLAELLIHSKGRIRDKLVVISEEAK